MTHMCTQFKAYLQILDTISIQYIIKYIQIQVGILIQITQFLTNKSFWLQSMQNFKIIF